MGGSATAQEAVTAGMVLAFQEGGGGHGDSQQPLALCGLPRSSPLHEGVATLGGVVRTSLEW